MATIPHKSEQLDILESPIVLPVRFVKSLRENEGSIASLRQLLSEGNEDAGKAISGGGDNISMTITSSFIDWLAATDKAQKIMDLIQLDDKHPSGNVNSNNMITQRSNSDDGSLSL